jgi:hypothetical protein
MRKKVTQINNIRNEKGEETTHTKEIEGIIRDNFENLHSNKLENLKQMDNYLDTQDNLWRIPRRAATVVQQGKS